MSNLQCLQEFKVISTPAPTSLRFANAIYPTRAVLILKTPPSFKLFQSHGDWVMFKVSTNINNGKDVNACSHTFISNGVDVIETDATGRFPYRTESRLEYWEDLGGITDADIKNLCNAAQQYLKDDCRSENWDYLYFS